MDRELEEFSEGNTRAEPMEEGAKADPRWTSCLQPGGRQTEAELDRRTQ